MRHLICVFAALVAFLQCTLSHPLSETSSSLSKRTNPSTSTVSSYGFGDKPQDKASFGPNTAQVLYRADTRSPEQIRQAGGFFPHPGPELPAKYSLYSHVKGNIGNTAFVSSTEDPAIAVMYAQRLTQNSGKPAWIYKIEASPLAIDVNRSLRMLRFASNAEHAFMGGIPHSQIMGSVAAADVTAKNVGTAAFASNPAFRKGAVVGTSIRPELALFPDDHPAWKNKPWKWLRIKGNSADKAASVYQKVRANIEKSMAAKAKRLGVKQPTLDHGHGDGGDGNKAAYLRDRLLGRFRTKTNKQTPHSDKNSETNSKLGAKKTAASQDGNGAAEANPSPGLSQIGQQSSHNNLKLNMDNKPPDDDQDAAPRGKNKANIPKTSSDLAKNREQSLPSRGKDSKAYPNPPDDDQDAAVSQNTNKAAKPGTSRSLAIKDHNSAASPHKDSFHSTDKGPPTDDGTEGGGLIHKQLSSKQPGTNKRKFPGIFSGSKKGVSSSKTPIDGSVGNKGTSRNIGTNSIKRPVKGHDAGKPTKGGAPGRVDRGKAWLSNKWRSVKDRVTGNRSTSSGRGRG